ncbi:MAG: exodeoxyribonuclease VII small subunit, partial [Myxococcota bacterium]
EAGGAGEAGAAEPVAPSFEGALAELEAVVGRLESGDLPLEQALEAFESGIKLSRQCAATLDAAERRIEILMAGRGAGGARVEPFAAGRRDGRAADAAPDAGDDGLDVDAGLDEPDDDPER